MTIFHLEYHEDCRYFRIIPAMELHCSSEYSRADEKAQPVFAKT